MRLVNKLVFLQQVLTPAKAWNLVVKEFQSFFGHSYLFHLPNKINIDIGNVCDLKCPLCPTGRGDRSASKGFMRFEDYKRIIDDVGKYITNLDADGVAL